MSSLRSSTIHSYSSNSEAMHRASVDSTSTNGTSASDFFAAVATEPPREEDYRGYPVQETAWSLSQSKVVGEPSDDLPSADKLAEAARIPLLDADGNETSFGDLCRGASNVHERRLVLFIRHWYCRACQDYVKSLKDLIASPKSDTKNTSRPSMEVIFIGCGHPSLIKSYIRRTNCPFPIYTEPSLKLLRILGCHRWGGALWGVGPKPQYTSTPPGEQIVKSLFDQYKGVFTDSLTPKTSGRGTGELDAGQESVAEPGLKKWPSRSNLQSGPIFQVGGEFLFQDGRLIWCHRMKGTRTHAEVQTLRRVLDLEDGDDSIEARLESKWVEQELREHQVHGRRPSKELRRKAANLTKAYENSPTTREMLRKPISDEEEDQYLERQLGRKPSLPTIQNGMRVVREPNSTKARLVKDRSTARRTVMAEG